MAGGVGHTGGLTNLRPWRGRYQVGSSNTGRPPLLQKRAPSPKKELIAFYKKCLQMSKSPGVGGSKSYTPCHILAKCLTI